MHENNSIVVLTREKQYLGNMQELLETMGYPVVTFATLITEPLDNAEIRRLFSQLDQFTDLVFVSRNAVEYAMALLEQLQLSVPDNIRVLAVGGETAKQLRKHNINALFPEQGSGIEALLSVSQLAELSARKLLIVRGTRGLNWPIEEFRNRGADVEQADIYEQIKPLESLSVVTKYLAEDHQIGCIFLHSAQSAVNFMQMVEPQINKLDETKLIVGSERIATQLRDLGWLNRIKVATSPSNKHMMLAFSQEHVGITA